MQLKRIARQPRRMWFGLNRIPLFPRCVITGAALAVTAGAIWGFVRGLSYLPTLPVAIIEGAILIGIPGTLVAIVVAGVVTLIDRIFRTIHH
jgi:hypothetical protein